ncbi:MAG: aminotransferase class V-fold PLP-dependent enzyme [Candidatus Diapherotrites archaeon]|uniref:Aminotransferase class V-fold PLP-dependent enzyme n=1 Tax=Candidatus Iainarchaeum sp. TaxID=3101447 RepID=A0A8T4LGE1_9ARCH|nr:aminotransferase class V-fold PLP-dependent enzyme [Candidatus Diapherotrites archaeon]
MIRLNNAATTPPFVETCSAVNRFLKTYGALHRGAGPNANKTVNEVNQSVRIIRSFVNASKDQSVLFTQNTSEAINLLARLFRLNKKDVILTSSVEHTSNNLPWRYNTPAKIVSVHSFPDGSLDLRDFEKKAIRFRKKLRIVAITGASNQTGYIPNIPKISKITHQNNGLLFIDAAQLAPHRPINMKRDGIDALAFSGHKLYAPFGTGVLVLPQKLLDSVPVNPGGGSIDMISTHGIIWSAPAVRHQTGTWNATGIIALGASCRIIRKIGWKKIMKHERQLLNYTLQQLQKIPEVTLYVSPEKYLLENRVATIPFNLKGFHHAKLSAILDHEYGIETRAGTICNHQLVRKWFQVSNKTQKEIEKKIRKKNRLASYGIVRISIGLHNSFSDMRKLIRAIKKVNQNGSALKYKPDPLDETFVPDQRQVPSFHDAK